MTYQMQERFHEAEGGIQTRARVDLAHSYDDEESVARRLHEQSNGVDGYTEETESGTLVTDGIALAIAVNAAFGPSVLRVTAR